MDMNTLYGGFAAALISDPLWVMNVVSSYAANSLAVMYDRGLIGTYHDWCEMKHVLLEMDRILRPNGYTIVRETNYYVDAVAAIAKGMRWGCRKEKTEKGVENEKILICQKKLWYSSNQNSR
ncbi:hypothetical protein Vadar_006144 [Vaccinium darrowii]|uniref:Uncharacterized protein n=1 Tax=Vaccinium darrowii TaxID=229202 RepID=A0ACB7WYS8_9ERIC|nr:hypothetical protein Vadar_006144 [Vaccinium darrowii]